MIVPKFNKILNYIQTVTNVVVYLCQKPKTKRDKSDDYQRVLASIGGNKFNKNSG